jgi:hypothetical protein
MPPKTARRLLSTQVEYTTSTARNLLDDGIGDTADGPSQSVDLNREPRSCRNSDARGRARREAGTRGTLASLPSSSDRSIPWCNGERGLSRAEWTQALGVKPPVRQVGKTSNHELK